MKRAILLIPGLLSLLLAGAQPELPALDKSVMDMCYYPADYPVLKIRGKIAESPLARVIYSRPKREDRTVFGELIPYGEIWRLGANEATEIEFFSAVTIAGKKIPKGRYTLYALINESSWTFIINKETDTWGAFKYDETKDIVRLEAPVNQRPDTVEVLSMEFVKGGNGFNLVVAWENISAVLPVSL